MTKHFDEQYPRWKKIIEQDDKAIRRMERAKERYERREDKKDLKELRRYEKILDKDWL